MEWTFDGEVFEWRGPAPYYFVETSPEADAYLHDNLGELTYGWGCISAYVQVGDTTEKTSLMPRDDVYLVPLKARLRRAEGFDIGERITVTLTVADFSAHR